MDIFKNINKSKLYRIASLLFVVGVAVGGYFQPLVGLTIPLLLLLALILNIRGRRLFCSSVCPNGKTYAQVLKRVSWGRRLPTLLKSGEFRKVLCGLMLFCVISGLTRFGHGWAGVARVFWAVYVLSLGIGTIMGLIFKPRAWCVVCPVGTLQETLSGEKGSRDA